MDDPLQLFRYEMVFTIIQSHIAILYNICNILKHKTQYSIDPYCFTLSKNKIFVSSNKAHPYYSQYLQSPILQYDQVIYTVNCVSSSTHKS